MVSIRPFVRWLVIWFWFLVIVVRLVRFRATPISAMTALSNHTELVTLMHPFDRWWLSNRLLQRLIERMDSVSTLAQKQIFQRQFVHHQNLLIRSFRWRCSFWLRHRALMMADLRMTAAMKWAINVMCLGVQVFDLTWWIQMLGLCCAGCDALGVRSLKHHVSRQNRMDNWMRGMAMARRRLRVPFVVELLWPLNVLIK